ncbi:MAG TPA: cbb3-type cytochrome c oxidase subunit I [Candidatus Kapabacteria bacterium]|nr:cbb3-type cytochrome c oxidase subunit I [Candidatus Kapabacteria bacterium]
MSTIVLPKEIKIAGAHAHEHHELSFWRKYIFSTDHKTIGIQFLFTSCFFLLVGGLLALVVRLQLGWPDHQGWFYTIMAKFFSLIFGEKMIAGGIILPEFYNSAFTMHATFMIFFAVMPFLMGTFANFLIPLQLGAGDMAFPKLNMASFWLALLAGLVMMSAFLVPGGAAGGGWTSYPTLSAVPELSGVTWGQNLWLISLLFSGCASLMGAINYITTVVNMRAPGMSWFRMPLPIWAIFITAILLLLAVPVLAAALVLLLFDRTIGTSFFIPHGLLVAGSPITGHAGGGQVLLWQHLFWFFGHPEVYIMILPAMGLASEIISVFARKPIFGYKAMVLAIAGIAFLGFIVWGHHMFQSGMNPLLGTTFMISTMVIAVPSAIKTFNWLGTLWGANIKFTTAFMFAVGFVSMFVIGGLSGIFMASTPVDIFIHDTYFIVGHIHYVLFGGSIMSIFAGIYYWFPKMFGRMMNETLGKIHFWLLFLSFNGVFFPMHILGINGMMRRIYDYTQYAHLAHLQPLNAFMSVCAFILGFSVLIFLFNLIYSIFRGKKAPTNPWHANTLEWTLTYPIPHGNFAEQPRVFRGPYEYSSPDAPEGMDYYPQNMPPPGWGPSSEAAHTH